MHQQRKTRVLPAEKQRLQKRIFELKKKVKGLEAERDALRQAVHAWAKERISDQDLRRWFESGEEEYEGSLMDLVEVGDQA